MVGLGVTVSAVATRLPWRRWQRSASYPIATIVACDIVDKRAQSDRQVSLFDLNLIFVFVEAYRCERTFLVVVPCTKNNRISISCPIRVLRKVPSIKTRVRRKITHSVRTYAVDWDKVRMVYYC